MKTIFWVGLLAGLVAATPAPALDWITIWTEDDSWVAVSDDGEIWQLGPGSPATHVGSLGPGPWVDFARRTSQHPHQLFALRRNGEVWQWQFWGPATLFRTLPGDRQWCALELGQEVGAAPYWALSCGGEVWALNDPPQQAASFVEPPVPTTDTSWSRMKEAHR